MPYCRLLSKRGALLALALVVLLAAAPRQAAVSQEPPARPGAAPPEDAEAENAGEIKPDPKRAVARNRFKNSLLKQWKGQKEGYFLLALEQASGRLDIRFTVCEGVEAAAEEAANFMHQGGPPQCRYQLVAWFPEGGQGKAFVQTHKARLEKAIALRLKDPVFDRSPCYSDLNPSSGKSINQKVAEGTCVIYRPFR